MLNSKIDLQKCSLRKLAQVITLVENEEEGSKLFLENLKPLREVPVIGITGPPGAGKSTLINALIKEILKADKNLKGRGIAVVAIDPSSPFSQGALLGDRLRMSEWFVHPKVFIRSLASRGSLGGLSARTIETVDILRSAGFDFIFVETVGIGQSEVEIASLADVTVLVLVPESGDDIQAMKAGVMEIADVFVVNKSDREDASRLKNSIQSAAYASGHSIPEIVHTIATQQTGIAELLKVILEKKDKISDERSTSLLVQKALRIIQNNLIRSVDISMLTETIKKESSDPNFNIYRLAHHIGSKK